MSPSETKTEALIKKLTKDKPGFDSSAIRLTVGWYSYPTEKWICSLQVEYHIWLEGTSYVSLDRALFELIREVNAYGKRMQQAKKLELEMAEQKRRFPPGRMLFGDVK